LTDYSLSYYKNVLSMHTLINIWVIYLC